MNTRFRPSLSKEELQAIGKRKDVRDIHPLLWEIARLRSVVLRADQLMSGSDPSGIIRNELRRELDECSCVQEMKRLRQDLFRKR